jgi:hypothetical protein
VTAAHLDDDGIGVDDDVARFVPFGEDQRRFGRLGAVIDRSACEILDPAGLGLKNDNAVNQTIGGDDFARRKLLVDADARRLSPLDRRR